MHVHESLPRDVARVLIWYPGRWLLQALPTSMSLRTMAALGSLHATLAPGRIRSLADRMEEGGIGDERFAQARLHMRNHYVDRLHIFLYPRWARREEPPGFLSVAGREHLDRALEAGRGAVLVHPHYAVPQLLPVGLGLQRYRCLQVGLPSDEGLSEVGRAVAFRIRTRLEEKLPARILPADRFLRPAFEWLAGGGVVLITGDGVGGGRFTGKAAVARLRGRDVRLPMGPARLALKAACPLVPALVESDGASSYRLRIDAPLTDGSGSAGAEELTRAFAEWFDARLEGAPGLWHFWEDFRSGNLLVDTTP